MIHEIKTLENSLCQNNEGEYLGKNGKLQVQVSHPDKPVSACCN